MNKSIFELIKLGRKFVNYWPKSPELLQYFTEYRSVLVARFVMRYFPLLALVVFIVQLSLSNGSIMENGEVLGKALMYFVFIASMPIQALLLLGKKSEKHLPPALASWYREGANKFMEQGGDTKLTLFRPKYMDLAQLLHITYTK